MSPFMLPEEIRLRIFKLGKLKELYHDDPEFCARQDIRIGSLQQIQQNIEQHQKHRAARHQRKAFSRSFRGSSRTKRSAFFQWSHARNSPPPQLKTILKEGF